MQHIKKFLVIDCYAFTTICLINGVLVVTKLNENQVSISYVLPMFLISSVITLLIMLTDVLIKENGLIRRMVHVIDILVAVFGYAMVTMDSMLTLDQIMANIVVCLVCYGIVYGMMLVSWREKDIRVNQHLQRMRENRKKQM